MLQCVAVCCSVLQCVVVFCRVLQCESVAVCVAVRSSVFSCIHVSLCVHIHEYLHLAMRRTSWSSSGISLYSCLFTSVLQCVLQCVFMYTGLFVCVYIFLCAYISSVCIYIKCVHIHGYLPVCSGGGISLCSCTFSHSCRCWNRTWGRVGCENMGQWQLVASETQPGSNMLYTNFHDMPINCQCRVWEHGAV